LNLVLGFQAKSGASQTALATFREYNPHYTLETYIPTMTKTDAAKVVEDLDNQGL
jgi:hypothetical protein